MEHQLQLEQLLERYRWSGRFHGRKLISGAGPFSEDSIKNGFPFITHLEEKGADILRHGPSNEHEAQTFILEIIQWGGAQRGRDVRFMLGMNSQKNTEPAHSVLATIAEMLHICALEDPSKPVEKAMELPSIGLTYGSKILRFLDPENFPAIDSRIEEVFGRGDYSVLCNTQPKSMQRYAQWYQYIHQVRRSLNESFHPCDHKPWTAARVEMAHFQFATEELKKRKSSESASSGKPAHHSFDRASVCDEQIEDDGAFETLGGKHKRFCVCQTKPDMYKFVTAWESGRSFELDRRKVLDLLDHFRGKGWFPLANNVVRIRNGSEDKSGLGVYVVNKMNLLATDASQIASWLVRCGAIQWDGKTKSMRFAVLENWDGTL